MARALIILVLLLAGVPSLLVGCLRQMPPPVTAFMLQSPVSPVDYQWVPAEQIAEVARKAVVASEDQKFWNHRGFDLEAMEKARHDNQKRRRKRGASTISQQTAKNLFLWPGGGYLRKGIEAYFTVLIELFWPKARILEVYLNIAEFGPGIYGVEAASQKFFSKPAAQLTPSEAARLAAVLPNPKRWSAARPGPYVVTRSEWILRQMGYAPRDPTAPDEEPVEPVEPAEPVEPIEDAAIPVAVPLDVTAPVAEPATEAAGIAPDSGSVSETPAESDEASRDVDGATVTDDPLPEPAPAEAEQAEPSGLTP